MLQFTLLVLHQSISPDTFNMSKNFFMLSKSEDDNVLCQNVKENITEARLSELLLYESILPLESFLFLIKLFNMSEGGIDTIFKDIIEPSSKIVFAKKMIG